MKKEKRVKYQDGIVIGNIEDKSNVKNPIAKILVQRFDDVLFDFIENTYPKSVHEIGCGEGRITHELAQHYEIPIRASDFSQVMINELQTKNLTNVTAVKKNIYNLDKFEDRADLILCCEVLEHLEEPKKAMAALKELSGRCYIFSVPREPIWRILNMLRGKYLSNVGNTPGHLNHWSKKAFLEFLRDHDFRVVHVACPLPWIVVMGRFNAV